MSQVQGGAQGPVVLFPNKTGTALGEEDRLVVPVEKVAVGSEGGIGGKAH